VVNESEDLNINRRLLRGYYLFPSPIALKFMSLEHGHWASDKTIP
jgi:hypothetical protein